MPVYLYERSYKSGRRKGMVRFCLMHYDKGQRRYENLMLYSPNKRSDPAQYKLMRKTAEMMRAKREAENFLDAKGLPNFERLNASFPDYFEAWAAKKRVSNYRGAFKALEKFLGGVPLPFSGITPYWIECYQNHLKENYTSNTANVYYAHLKTAVKMAYKHSILQTNPLERVTNTVRPKEVERRFLSLEEIGKLVATECPKPELKRAFLFSCFSGLRISDVRTLRWGNIIKNDNLEFRQRKTGGLEYFPLSDAAKTLLEEQRASLPDPCLVTDTMQIFHLPPSNSAGRYLGEWAKNAGVEYFTFHAARHSFATLSISHGADIYTVSKLLGHKDLKTTMIYGKIIDSKKREAVALLPALPGTVKRLPEHQ
jgi:integrase